MIHIFKVIVLFLVIVHHSSGLDDKPKKLVKRMIGRYPYGFSGDECTIKVKKPNFEKLGRRKSETKCLEYIWDLNEKPWLQFNLEARCKDYQIRLFQMGMGPPVTMDIAGGQFIKPREIPHMAAIGWRSFGEDGWIFKCAGTIISPKFILTAAHCTRSSRDSRISNQAPEVIRIGTVSLSADKIYNDSAKNVEINRIIPHPNYNSPKKYFDIALIEFKTAEAFNYDIAPVCLWQDIDINKLGAEISSAGWGATAEGARENSNVLKAANLDIVDQRVCHRLLQPKANRNWWGLAEHQMCAGKLDGGVDTCQGDSGGPLQVPINMKTHLKEKPKMFYLLGVTSFGFGCARKNSPGVYTRVASFIDWIEEIVWPDEPVSESM